MATKSDGGPAFPRSAAYGTAGQVGMTKRELIASEQMAALLSRGETIDSPGEYAAIAIQLADALLAELEKEHD